MLTNVSRVYIYYAQNGTCNPKRLTAKQLRRLTHKYNKFGARNPYYCGEDY